MNLDILNKLQGNAWFGILIAPFIGSFVATAVERFAEGKGFVSGRSHCDGCGISLTFAELIPIGSWIVQRGECRRCGGSIGWQPLVTEAAYFGFTLITVLFSRGRNPWVGCVLTWCLLALAVIDLKTLLLPDKLTLPLIAGGIIASAIFKPNSVFDNMAAAAIGFLSLWAITMIYRALKGREGLGLGDAKLFAACGAWLGAIALPGVLFVASFTALAIEMGLGFFRQNHDKAQPIAFGPYLAFAGWAGWVLGPFMMAAQ